MDSRKAQFNNQGSLPINQRLTNNAVRTNDHSNPQKSHSKTNLHPLQQGHSRNIDHFAQEKQELTKKLDELTLKFENNVEFIKHLNQSKQELTALNYELKQELNQFREIIHVEEDPRDEELMIAMQYQKHMEMEKNTHHQPQLDSLDQFQNDSGVHSSQNQRIHNQSEDQVIIVQPFTEDELQLLNKTMVDQPQHNRCQLCKQMINKGQFESSLYCEHIFHYPCLKNYLRLSRNCPVCNSQILL